MGERSGRRSYSFGFWGEGVSVSEDDRSSCKDCRTQVPSSCTLSLPPIVRTVEMADWLARTCSFSYSLRFLDLRLLRPIYVFQSARSVSLVRLLVGTCSGLSVVLWLLLRYWQVFDSDHASSCTPSFGRTGGAGDEKHSESTFGEGPDVLRHFVPSWGRESTTKTSSRGLQSDRVITCNHSNNGPALHHEIQCKRRYFNAAHNRATDCTHSVWFLLSRRKCGRTSALAKEVVWTHACCPFSAAGRQLSKLKFFTRHHIYSPFSRAAVSSIIPAASLDTPLEGAPTVPPEIHARFLLPIPQKIPTKSQQSLHSGQKSYAPTMWTSRGSLGSKTGRMASIFDVWQQVEPLSSETKQFLVQHLTEKALSHVLWFYKWQRENAVPLLLRYLLERGNQFQQKDVVYETERRDTEGTGNDEDGEQNDDDDDDNDDDDDDDDVDDDSTDAENEYENENFSTKYFPLREVNAQDNSGRSRDTQLNRYVGEFSGDHFGWRQRDHDEALLGQARRADPLDASSFLHTLDNNPEKNLYHGGSASDTDKISNVISTSEDISSIYESIGAPFITPDSPAWSSDVEAELWPYTRPTTLVSEFLSSVAIKNIPNITTTIDRLNLHMGSYLQRYKNAVWSLPLQQIVNATLNGGMFPPLVQLQNASFPDLKRDVKCNPDVQVCQNLGSLLRAIGGTMRTVFHETYPYNIHLRAESAANVLHSAIIGQRVTAAFYSIVEQIVTAALLETVLNATTTLIEIPPDSQVFTLINAILSLIGDVYSLADMPAEGKQQMNLVRSKVRVAFYCRVFNGRLPYCNASPTGFLPLPQIPREIVFDPYTGFVKFLYFKGFEAACIQRGGCFADLFVDGANFDGFYALVGIGSTGFPVYQGYRYFPQFTQLTRLFFWQGVRPSVIDSSQGSWAAITSAPETYFASTRGQLFPFASLATLNPPNNCSAFAPVPFGDPVTNFPLCINPSTLWVVGRLAAFGNCNGFLYSHVCVFPANVVIFPTTSPEYWTELTLTSTRAPTTTPATPPGGGVPPGGTGEGGTPGVTPSGKEAEGYSGVDAKVEYVFWDEGDSPFDTIYPWERKSLLSGWTGRRRTQQQSVRDRVRSQSTVDPLRTYPGRDKEAGFEDVDHEEDTVTLPAGITEESSSILDTSQRTPPLMDEERDDERVSGVREYSRTSLTFDEDKGGKKTPNDGATTMSASATSENSASRPQNVLLHGEAARKVVARKLEGLSGINGRRFQSPIPVHKSQFVDGFSGKVVTYMPPFFPFPPDLL